jgi:hypothetical protein
MYVWYHPLSANMPPEPSKVLVRSPELSLGWNIREHEKKNNLNPAHIIVLTSLTSASAKLEAWTSGVVDFLTNNELESLMKAGRRAGTGILDDRDKKTPESDPTPNQSQE